MADYYNITIPAGTTTFVGRHRLDEQVTTEETRVKAKWMFRAYQFEYTDPATGKDRRVRADDAISEGIPLAK